MLLELNFEIILLRVSIGSNKFNTQIMKIIVYLTTEANGDRNRRLALYKDKGRSAKTSSILN